MPEAQVLERVKKLITKPKLVEKPLKVLFVASEVAPFAQVGGVGQVLYYLPKALAAAGCEVRVLMPKYGVIELEKYPVEMVVERLKVPTDDPKKPVLICNVKKNLDSADVPIYFLENQEYYELRANVYGYSDDHVRWALLSRATLELIARWAKKSENWWVPDIIHCNDWHTGLIPNYLKTTYAANKIFSSIATVFTIHNLHFQGMFDHRNVSDMDFDDGKSPIPAFFDKRLAKLNYMRRAIIYADVVNAVSETYSREILTQEFGEGLEGLLLELRSKLFGVVNGLDYSSFDPARDKIIAKNFDADNLDLRKKNKLALQKEFNLPQDDERCILGMVTRLDLQKGIDLVLEVVPNILREFDCQLVIVGGGDLGFKSELEKLAKRFPDKVGIHLYPNFTLPRLVFAGADIFLMPSRFEPAGITQLEAMRYGAVPVVRQTGGLGDTVEQVDFKNGKGTGFVFRSFDPWSFYSAIVKALTLYQIEDYWREVIKRVMKVDFSWEKSGAAYLKLYQHGVDVASGKFEISEEY